MLISDWSSDVCSSDLQMFATVRVGEGRDVQRGDDRAASISDGHRQRSQTRSEFLLDQRPLLSGDEFQSIVQRRRIGDRKESCREKECQYVEIPGGAG